MINSFYLRGLVNSEFYQFIKLIVDKVDESDPTVLKIKNRRDDLFKILAPLKSALNQETANAETKVIEALDERRDNTFKGLSFNITGSTFHSDPVKSEAATLLQVFIKAQGSGIARLNYQAETSVLSKITDAFKNDAKYVAAVATLGLQDWITNLETANVEFENRFKARNTDISVNADAPSFGSLKKQAIPLYTSLVALIESRYEAALDDKAPTAGYEKLMNEVNTLIDSFSIYLSKPKAKPEEPAA